MLRRKSPLVARHRLATRVDECPVLKIADALAEPMPRGSTEQGRLDLDQLDRGHWVAACFMQINARPQLSP